MIRLLFVLLAFLTACEKEDIITEPAIADYYVDPEGDDGNTGDFEHPWATWQHAVEQLGPGDTVYIRGGRYLPRNHPNALNVYHKDGTASQPICIFNYPGEAPELDCSKKEAAKPSVGVNIVGSSHIIFRGLGFTGTIQSNDGETTVGCYLYDCNRVTFIETDSYGHQGSGFFLEGCDTITFQNCDAYGNYDLHSATPGNNADGFGIGNNPDLADIVIMKGCRAWNNSDDGFDAYNNEGTVVLDSCWSFSNGIDRGDGSGFKLGRTTKPAGGFPQRVVRYCIAADNKFIGFNENAVNVKMNIYNNTACRNSYGYGNFDFQGVKEEMYYRNNLAFGNREGPTFFKEAVLDEYNSWNLTLSVTSEDFESTDSGAMSHGRQKDGSLPVIGFMKPKAESDLIDAGTDVGLPYLGNAPDLGAFEIK